MPKSKFAYFLPNCFTALNIACGYFAIILAWRGQHYLACIVLLLGAIFDLVDGRVARLMGTQSEFGEQFDSISDVVSFGIAPAILVFTKYFNGLGRIGYIVSFIYLLCGALRLARFNTNNDKMHPNFFQGLPIPGAACGLIGLVLISAEFPILLDLPYITMPIVFFFSVLMISNIPFCSFKKSEWVKKHKKIAFVILLLLLCVTLLNEKYMILFNISLYVLGSIVYFLVNKGKLEHVFDWKSED